MSKVLSSRLISYNFGFESGFSVLRNFDPHRTIAGIDSLFFVPVAVIIRIGPFRFFIAEVVVHFGFHHFLDGAAEKILESILDIFSSFDIVLLQELLDNLTFTFNHYYLMDGFLFSF